MPSFVALDFETANSGRESACSVGLALCEGDEIVKTDYYLIRPKENFFDDYNTYLHGITDFMVENEPTFDKLLDRFYSFIGDRPVVAHNAAFDMSVLRHTLDSYSLNYPEINYTCTFQIARKVWKEFYCYSLPDVSNNLGIVFDHHNALEDATACAKIAFAAMNIYSIYDILDLARHINIRPGKIFHAGYCASSARDRKMWTDVNSIKAEALDFNDKHPLYGKNVCITQPLHSMERGEAVLKIKNVGADYKDSLTKKTNILVVGGGCRCLSDVAKTTNKIDKVKKYKQQGCPIEIIFENDLLRLLDWRED